MYHLSSQITDGLRRRRPGLGLVRRERLVRVRVCPVAPSPGPSLGLVP
jgi:hypothetical protein